MIKRKASQISILNRLKALEEQDQLKHSITNIFVGVDPDGRVYVLTPGKKTTYESMFEAEQAIPHIHGITPKTQVFIDCMNVLSDSMYLSAVPIMYYCFPEQRKKFIEFAGQGTEKEWLRLYIDVLERPAKLLAMMPALSDPAAFMDPDEMIFPEMMDLDDPSLLDLSNILDSGESISLEQLVERYQDRKWFMPEPQRA